MLLPSAISCDSSQPPRLQASLFASPPASPPQVSAQTAIGNIVTTCRSLQALLASPTLAVPAEPVTPPVSSYAQQHQQLPTPPMAHATPPLKLRLRSRRPADAAPSTPASTANPQVRSRRIVKRAAPPRGANKRRRPLGDDAGYENADGNTRDGDVDSELDIACSGQLLEAAAADEVADFSRPQTPKRARIAPEVLPLGLERADYHALHADGVFGADDSKAEGSDVVVEKDGEAWSTEEDRILVELVLEKLKLSKSDWQDCARSLGKDRGSVGRRWKSLMVNGEIGLKRSSRRGKIHGTWR